MPLLCTTLALACMQEPGPPLPAATPAFALVTVREHTSDSPGDGFGHGLAFLGDVDRDGTSDYAIGAPRDPSRADTDGSVAVYSGKTGRLLFLHRGLLSGAGFGFAVAGGDVDGDGAADVLVAAPYASSDEQPNAGSVASYSGKDGRLARELWGNSGDAYGWSLANVGDLDKDGCDDYAIGAPHADRALGGGREALDVGRVEVRSGKKAKLLYTLWGEAAEDRFGWCISQVEDFDGDGSKDILIGAEGATQGKERPGSATLVSGRSGSVITRFRGDSGTYFGAAVCSVPDLDGDGRSELAVGAWNAGPDDRRAGEVRILSSRTRGVLQVLRGRAHLDQFGRALACPGDLDGDGTADLVVGAPSTTSGGYVQFVSLKTASVLAERHGAHAGERFGATLRAEDLDGDGRREVLVGVGLADAQGALAGRVLLMTTKPGETARGK